MDSPWLQLIYLLSERFGEYDTRKIAALPAEMLLYWQAWFSLRDGGDSDGKPDNPTPVTPAVSQQCADVMRILGQ